MANMPWVWSPAASAAKEQYEVAEERRKQRDDQTNALARQQQASDLALRNLLEGKKYDEGAKEREGAAEIEALNQFFERSPKEAARAGFTGAPTMEWGTEEGAGMMPQPGKFQRFQPPARGAKTIADLIKQRVTETGKPIVLGEGAEAYSPTGELIASNAPSGTGYFPTAEAARAEIVRREAAEPGTRGRWTIGQEAKGFRIGQAPTEQLTESLPVWISQYNDKATPAEEKLVLRKKIDNYVTEQGKIQAARTQAQVANTPMSADQVNAVTALSRASASLGYIRETFTGEEIRLFTGLSGYKGRAANFLKGVEDIGLPGFTEIANTLRKAAGGGDELLERYNNFVANNQGINKDTLFQEAGKQLTGIEKSVMTATIPQPEDYGHVWLAKAKLAEKALKASAQVRIDLQREGKAENDPIEVENRFRIMLSQQGIDAKNPLSSSSLGDPSAAARAKFDKTKGPR